MKQVVQDLRSGDLHVLDVPEPGPEPGYVLVAVERSLISPGTERALIELGARSLAGKARARPDLVRKVVSTARTEGLRATAARVRGRLDRYLELGYSAAGRVLDTGGARGLAAGQRVACVGAGYAVHAGVVSVPASLVVPVPQGVGVDEAAFAAPAAIALHGLRLADQQAGAVVAVLGLGLVGRLATRLGRASGFTVVGYDPRTDRVGVDGRAASEPDAFAALVADTSRGRGADAVLVCAATSSSEPVALAAEVARDRARVVVVGDVGLELDRRPLYDKELSLVVARSYGPGRYDRDYEERGLDYPAGHVRWTESRNVEAVLDLVAAGSLVLGDLVTNRFAIEDGGRAYETLRDDPSALAVLLEYAAEPERVRRVGAPVRPTGDRLRVGLVGAGAFARGTLVPALTALDGVDLAAVCTRSGASGRSLADSEGIAVVSTDWRELAASRDVDALVVATPHATHAEIAAAGLEAGKAVFVEKPLAVTPEGLAAVAAAARAGGLLLVGHNRRFAPLAVRLRDAVGRPVLVQIRVAAGPLQPGHWLEDAEQGGRVLGEISHFVDLASFLAGGPPVSVHALAVPAGDGVESLLASLQFADGSAASVAYGVGGSAGMPKERIEALGQAAAGVLDDFARLDLHGAARGGGRGRRDKGHGQQLEAFVAAALGRSEPPVAVEEQLLVAAASLAVLDAARTGEPRDVRLPG